MPKPKDIPECPRVPAVHLSPSGLLEYQIELFTPMFGGGAEARTPDPTLPFRGMSIRGHLQFWWRATRGAAALTGQELAAQHAAVWGTTEAASPVIVEVADVRAADPRPCARYTWNPQARNNEGGWRTSPTWEPPFRDTALHYALFPFQGRPPKPARDAEPEEWPAHFIESGSFTLRLRFPEALREELETAASAWVNFGGLGARTRRGCGALYCEKLAPKDLGTLDEWFRTALGSIPTEVRDWPMVPRGILVRRQPDAPIPVWDWVIGFWRHFRQGEGLGRNPGRQGRPGRSRFPEPETIRRVTGRRSHQHARLPQIPDDAFPRAELGLPIIFHFPPGQGEPPDTTLSPVYRSVRRDRMASFIILKPLALSNRQAVHLIVPLSVRPLENVELTARDEKTKATKILGTWSANALRDKRLAEYPQSPLSASPVGSACDAFLALARTADNGFQEITR